MVPFSLQSSLPPASLPSLHQSSGLRSRKMLPMMKKELSFDLPEDVIVKILLRLPVRSLIRFSCVSKRWRTIIIFDPQFGKAHVKLASELRTITRRLLLQKRPASLYTSQQSPGSHSENSVGYLRHQSMPSEGSIISLENSFRDDSLVRNLTMPSDVNITNVVASCNGLVLLGTDYIYLCIWNPSTGFFRKLPALEFTAITIEWDTNNAKYGFGYISSTDDYIVLVIPACYRPVDGDVKMCIFSMRANSWKISKVSGWFSLWFSIGYSRPNESGTLVNEAIHWAYCHRYNRDGRLVEEMKIYAFDLANEEPRQLPVPPFNRDDTGNGVQMQNVDSLGGRLCVLFRTWRSLWRMVEDIELWMMRDYGVSDSWMKLFKFRSSDLLDVMKFYSPIFVTGDGSIVINVTHNELVVIECRQEEKPVCRDRYKLEELPGCNLPLDVILYDETLLSVTE